MKSVSTAKSLKYLAAILTVCFVLSAPNALAESEKTTISDNAAVAQKQKPRTRNQERLIAIVNERADILNSRWQALAHRLDNISDRTASLLSRMKKEGADTTTGETLLETAKMKINAARERSVTAYTKITERALATNGTASDLYKIEKDFISPEKDAVAKAFQEAKDSLGNCLASLSQNN